MNMSPLLIQTQQLIIRHFSKADLADFTKYRANPAIAKYQSWSDFTYEDALRLYEKINKSEFGTVEAWFQLAIEQKDTQMLAGDLAVHFMEYDQVEVGFTIAPEFQQKGIALEALNALMGYLFNEMNKHRIIAVTDIKNRASCRLLEKAGFRKEAHFKENIFFKGAWGSEYVFAILNSEWDFKS